LSFTGLLFGFATELARGNNFGDPEPVALGVVQRQAVILSIELAVLSKDIKTPDRLGGF
jgi:hypothetical protein